jgi:hypothetical protein
MPAPDRITVEAGSPSPFCKEEAGRAVRNSESAAIAPVMVFAFLGMIFGGGRGPGSSQQRSGTKDGGGV